MSQENVEIVRRLFGVYLEALDRGDLDIWFDSDDLAEDFEWVMPREGGLGLPPSYRGREGFREFMQAWTQEQFQDWSIELERLLDAGGNRVVAFFHQRAIGRVSGVPVDLRMATLYELEDGRILRMRHFLDREEALEAAGLSGE
jgi:ketosteroid isomerase-like protein